MAATTMTRDGIIREIAEDGHIIIPEFEPEANRIFSVWSTFNKGKTFELLYKGHVRKTAVDKANFWDERQDTFFCEHRIPMDALSVALRKLDALAASLYAKLP